MTENLCDWLDDYLDHDLSHQRQALFAEHLDQCTACRKAADDWQMTCQVLRTATEQRESPRFQLIARIQKQAPTVVTNLNHQQRSPMANVVVAAALIVAGIWLGTVTVIRLNPEDDRLVALPKPSPDTAAPGVTLQFSDDVISVPIDIGDPKVTVVWLYPAGHGRHVSN